MKVMIVEGLVAVFIAHGHHAARPIDGLEVRSVLARRLAQHGVKVRLEFVRQIPRLRVFQTVRDFRDLRKFEELLPENVHAAVHGPPAVRTVLPM